MSDSTDKPVTEVEETKARSRRLRGSLSESLVDPVTGAIAADDTHISKFHGIYQQDDRDDRAERTKQKLEPDYSFMIRVRVPAGVCTPGQWLAMDQLAQNYANGTLRLTTRQAFQFHGVLKGDLRTTIQGIDDVLLDTLAACGDVNRNVMCTPLAASVQVHREASHWAARISEHLTPRTRAYHEIWLGSEKLPDSQAEEEPIYGATYLPRKFKIAVAIPPFNDVDVFAQDLGFVAIERDGELVGFNVTVGGGMGVTHGEPATYPRLADVIGFCSPTEVLRVAEAVVKIQRDYGDRTDRKHARLKYTIDDRGLDWFMEELAGRGVQLSSAATAAFEHTGDRYGWLQDSDGLWHVTLLIPAGRVMDLESAPLRTGLNAIAQILDGEFRITPNQNLIISGIEEGHKAEIERLIKDHGLDSWRSATPVRRNALACVALPTCGLAMAEAERFLPSFIDRIEALLARHQLSDEDLLLRITGCPNGCARPYLADIGLIGKAPGRYNLKLGGGSAGARLNMDYRGNLSEGRILEVLDELFADFVESRESGEGFSDFLLRTQRLEGELHA
jgi:sulfite reductase (NADPH) hemoprotein beta-component